MCLRLVCCSTYNNDGNCFVLTGTMLDGNMSFRLSSTPFMSKEVLNYGDFIYDKEFGLYACHQLTLDHSYPLEGVQIHSLLSSSMGTMAVTMPLGAIAEARCDICGIGNRMLYCILNPPECDNWHCSLGGPPCFGGSFHQYCTCVERDVLHHYNIKMCPRMDVFILFVLILMSLLLLLFR